jgi:hypothetical protein
MLSTYWVALAAVSFARAAAFERDALSSRASALSCPEIAEAPSLAAQGFAAELIDAFEVTPVVTVGELISRPPVFTRLVLITAHARKIDANRHTMANKPV